MISQILAVIIFLAMFILIITEVWERHIVTLGCALLTLVVILGICYRYLEPENLFHRSILAHNRAGK